VRAPEAESTAEGTGVEALREQASRETKALIQDFKFRTTYGFSPLPRYELAFQISGEIPPISAEQLPPHFEQLVVVEVTISTEGRVADARIVAGIVDEKIQQTLLAAIREFKYRPATREGIPVPSQCDLVIHIPT
jgi:TonB family protein